MKASNSYDDSAGPFLKNLTQRMVHAEKEAQGGSQSKPFCKPVMMR